MMRCVWDQGKGSGVRSVSQRTSGRDAGLCGVWSAAPAVRGEGNQVVSGFTLLSA